MQNQEEKSYFFFKETLIILVNSSTSFTKFKYIWLKVNSIIYCNEIDSVLIYVTQKVRKFNQLLLCIFPT